MRKVLVVLPLLLPLLLPLVSGCDSTRRDFTYCDTTYSQCAYGFTCNMTSGLCVPATDAGSADTRVLDTNPSIDLSSPVDVTASDVADAPIAIDGAPVDGGPVVDTSIIDAPQTVDTTLSDTRGTDGPGTCLVDNDCAVVAGRPYCVNDKCVACRTSNQCNNDAGAPFCSAQNTCVSCSGASGPDGGSACPATAPLCAQSGSCVECLSNNDCPHGGSKGFCVQGLCKGCDSAGATASPVDGGATDGGLGSPRACTGGTICVSSASPITAIAGQCVGCVTDVDCLDPTAPICTPTATATVPAYTCTGCTSDTQCSNKEKETSVVGPGVCMFHQDGRCATEAETIYVKNPVGCSGGTGTAASPFCQSQDAISAITGSKRLIVMLGPAADTLYPINSTPSGSQQLTVVGQNGATISPGAYVGVHVTAGNVYIRGITVANGTNIGVVADTGTILKVNRSVIKMNKGGLLINTGVEFEIVNSVFDSNLQGSDGQGRFFGGALLLATPAPGKTTRFWFNTALNNQDKGVVCASNTQLLEGVLLTGNVTGDQGNCSLPTLPNKPYTTSDTGANDTRPQPFDPAKPYHLIKTNSPTATSPCIDFITDPAVQYPPDDIDGQTRPYGAGIDCGADEYWPAGQ